MRQLLQILQKAWQHKIAFRWALVYLCLLLVLVLVLPWLPLAFQPNELDLLHVFQRPFDWSRHEQQQPFHWLGTDALGRDVLANTLFGARTALAISFPVMVLTTGLGLLLGTSAGFFGNDKILVSRGKMAMLVAAGIAFGYYGVYVPLELNRLELGGTSYTLLLSLALPALLLFGVAPLLSKVAFLGRQTPLPLDRLVLRLIELLTSIPRLILILALAAFAPPSLLLLSLLLVLTFWTGTARLARAETLRIREMPYFEAAISIGVAQSRLLYRHALPNLLAPVLVSFVFGLASLMMLESTLSFLNIGVSTDLVSWGRLIAGIRANTSAWWLVVFPGAFLSVTVLALQTCSYYLLKFSQAKS